MIYSHLSLSRSRPKKVQGYADKKKLRLNKYEKLNVEMDLKAKQFRLDLENKKSDT